MPLMIWGIAKELWPVVRELVGSIMARDRKAAELALVRALAAADALAMRKLRGEKL